jgi:hypothetical protein
MRTGFAGTTALALAALFTVACSGVVDPSKNVIDSFSGTIPVQGSDTKAFSTSKTGEFSIKVTSLTPATTSFFGVILAQGPNDHTCSGNLPILQQNSFASVNQLAMSGAILPGDYCVYLYDIGAFTTPESYTVSVSHP